MSAETRPAEQRTSGLAFRAWRLRWPEWTVGISALVLVILLFAPSWYTVTPSGNQVAVPVLYAPKYSLNGWDGISHAHWLLLVTIIAAFVLFILQGTRRSPAWPVTFSLLVFFLGLLSTIWLIVRVVIDPPGSAEPAAWVALITAVILTLAGLRSFSLEGIAAEDAPEIRLVTRAELTAERSEHHAVASEAATGGSQPTDRS